MSAFLWSVTLFAGFDSPCFSIECGDGSKKIRKSLWLFKTDRAACVAFDSVKGYSTLCQYVLG